MITSHREKNLQPKDFLASVDIELPETIITIRSIFSIRCSKCYSTVNRLQITAKLDVKYWIPTCQQVDGLFSLGWGHQLQCPGSAYSSVYKCVFYREIQNTHCASLFTTLAQGYGESSPKSAPRSTHSSNTEPRSVALKVLCVNIWSNLRHWIPFLSFICASILMSPLPRQACGWFKMFFVKDLGLFLSTVHGTWLCARPRVPRLSANGEQKWPTLVFGNRVR